MSFTQFLSVFAARWKVSLAVFSTVAVAASILSFVLPNRYTAVASILVESKADSLSVVLYPSGFSSSLNATQIDVITSGRVAYKAVQNRKPTENPTIRTQWLKSTKGEGSIEQWWSAVFQKSLEVKPSRDSGIVNGTDQSPDLCFAAGLTNAFVKAYLQVILKMRVEPAKLFSSFFETRASESREHLAKAQVHVPEIQKVKGIIASDERLGVENTRLNAISSQMVGLRALSSNFGNRETASSGAAGNQMQEILASPLLLGLEADQARLEFRMEKLNSKVGENYPQVIEAKANLLVLRKRIEMEFVEVVSSLGAANSINRQRLVELRDSLETQRTKVFQMKATCDEGSAMLHDVESAQRTYDQILQRLNQTILESQAIQSNVTVLTQAVPPTSPGALLNLLVAIFLGTLLAVAVVPIRDVFDRRIRKAEDVVLAIALSILGVIPQPSVKRLFGRATKANLMQSRLLVPTSEAGNGV